MSNDEDWGSKDFVVKVEMAQSRRGFTLEELASSCSCEKTIVLPYCDPVEPCEKKDWHSAGSNELHLSLAYTYSTWDGIIIWKAAAPWHIQLKICCFAAADFKRELRALLFVRGKSSKMSRKINSQKPTKDKCKFFRGDNFWLYCGKTQKWLVML